MLNGGYFFVIVAELFLSTILVTISSLWLLCERGILHLIIAVTAIQLDEIWCFTGGGVKSNKKIKKKTSQHIVTDG
jgi:hypothetical protein